MRFYLRLLNANNCRIYSGGKQWWKIHQIPRNQGNYYLVNNNNNNESYGKGGEERKI